MEKKLKEEEVTIKKQRQEEEEKNKANKIKDDSNRKNGLRKIQNILEDIDKPNKSAEAPLAPWQLELKKKRQTFKDGFV